MGVDGAVAIFGGESSDIECISGGRLRERVSGKKRGAPLSKREKASLSSVTSRDMFSTSKTVLHKNNHTIDLNFGSWTIIRWLVRRNARGNGHTLGLLMEQIMEKMRCCELETNANGMNDGLNEPTDPPCMSSN